jgi:carbon-monoxide dehydrogenase small subunit
MIVDGGSKVSDVEISIVVNGGERTGRAEPRRLLADFLREELGLTGTHVGCEQGACGSCTVLVDGEPVRSCLMLAVQARGRSVETIEGLAVNGRLHPVQRAFMESHSFQCGFCTPGFVLTTVALLGETPSPSEDEVREALSGNLCRCTGYTSIVAGVRLAARLLAEEGGG